MMYLMSSILLDLARPRKTRTRDVLGVRNDDHYSKLFRTQVIPRHDGDDSEAEEDTGPPDQDQKPEPEENVDLLVNDIQRQNAQS